MFLNDASHLPKIFDFLNSLGSTPALTWYSGDDSGQRIELSGKVCVNHISKIANYLSFECSFVAGSTLWIDLAASWKSVLWASAGLYLGAHLEFINVSDSAVNHKMKLESAENISAVLEKYDFNDGDIVVTARPDYWVNGAGAEKVADVLLEIVALNLENFAFSWGADLPSEVLDGQAEVIGQADSLLVENQWLAANWQEFVVDREEGKSGALQKGVLLAKDPKMRRVAVQTDDMSTLFCQIFSAWNEEYSILTVASLKNVENILQTEGF